jgi:hypothetical protein
MADTTKMRRSNEYLFGRHKGHFYLSASTWENALPKDYLLETMAGIQLTAWRTHRENAYREMRDTQGAVAVKARNVREFKDPIGPTAAYFMGSTDAGDSLEWARRLITRTVEINGTKALSNLAKKRKEELASKEPLPPVLLPFGRTPLIFRTTNDVLRPWTTEDQGHRIEVQVNLFPDEVCYGLVVDGAVLGDFNEWPKQWRREQLVSHENC